MTNKQIQAAVLIQDLCLAFIINSAATVLNGGFTDFWAYFAGMFQAFSINYVAGLMIPVEKIGRGAAGGLGLKNGTFLHKAVRVFVINAIFVTIISFCIALINIGPVPEIFSIWMSTYPALHLVGFISSLLLDKPCGELAKAIVDK